MSHKSVVLFITLTAVLPLDVLPPHPHSPPLHLPLPPLAFVNNGPSRYYSIKSASCQMTIIISPPVAAFD